MIPFVIYELATGTILRTGACYWDSLYIQPLDEEKEALLVGEADARTQRVEKRRIVPIEPAV